MAGWPGIAIKRGINCRATAVARVPQRLGLDLFRFGSGAPPCRGERGQALSPSPCKTSSCTKALGGGVKWAGLVGGCGSGVGGTGRARGKAGSRCLGRPLQSGQHVQDELSHSGLPPCDAAVNLAGENVLNPLRRVVVASRVETTKTLAKAIAEAERLPRSWVLVTGVGYYRPSPTAEYTEESPGGDFDFFSRLVSAWEAAAKIPGDSTRQAVVRSGASGHGAFPL
nr:epimerase family protein SDR39U1 isoform X2 [Chrysemys picta bellii]